MIGRMKLHQNDRIIFPTMLLTISIILTLISMIMLSAFFKKSYHLLEEFIKYDMQIISMKNKVIYYDEVLTMSARLAANENQEFTLWYNRYNQYVLELDDLIKEMDKLANNLGYNTFFISETNLANQKLVELEKEAFDFVMQKNFVAARQKLFGDEYELYKKLYTQSIVQSTDQVRKSIDELLAKNKKNIFYIELFSTFGMVVLITIWIYTLIRIRYWLIRSEDLFDQLKLNNVKIEASVTQLKEKNYELERFNFFLAHDLKESLRTIYSFSQLIESELDNEKRNDYLRRIRNSCLSISSLMEDLLSYAKLDAKQSHSQEIDLNTLIDSICSESINGLIKSRNAKIIYDQLPHVFSDLVKLRQVFHNILTNAIIYNESKIPEIRISCTETEAAWIIKVQDNGIGILEEYFNKIFDFLVKLNSKKFHKGTGIGLYICKKNMLKIGGDIWVDKSDASGSIFKIRIPN